MLIKIDLIHHDYDASLKVQLIQDKMPIFMHIKKVEDNFKEKIYQLERKIIEINNGNEVILRSQTAVNLLNNRIERNLNDFKSNSEYKIANLNGTLAGLNDVLNENLRIVKISDIDKNNLVFQTSLNQLTLSIS